MKSATVFAPATVANVAVGFDILGFAIDVAGDTVQVTRSAVPGVEITGIEATFDLPRDPEKNTATVGLLSLIQEHELGHGFQVKIKKGIPLGSGMGGSAASAVGALVAANSLLDHPLPREELLKYALMGEKIASGSAHADNAAPCLFGGISLVQSVPYSETPEIISIPVPRGVECVLVHPHQRLDTRDARAVLRREVPLTDHVRQSAYLAGFLAACFKDDVALLGRSLRDFLIEPQRAKLIDGFESAKIAAGKAGALGFSISGSGPSVFALVAAGGGDPVRKAVQASFKSAGLESDAWIAPISLQGARLIKGESQAP